MSKPITPEFRVAFPSVFSARRNDLNGKDEYSIVALFPLGADLSALEAVALSALKTKFGDDQKKWPEKLRTPFRDQGDRAKKNDDGTVNLPSGYVKGAKYLTLRSNQQPGLIDGKKNEIIDQSDFYGGCWARATINAYAYDTKGNRGVSFGLGNIQKLRDDDPFGNRTKATDDFSAVVVDEKASETSASDIFAT